MGKGGGGSKKGNDQRQQSEIVEKEIQFFPYVEN